METAQQPLGPSLGADVCTAGRHGAHPKGADSTQIVFEPCWIDVAGCTRRTGSVRCSDYCGCLAATFGVSGAYSYLIWLGIVVGLTALATGRARRSPTNGWSPAAVGRIDELARRPFTAPLQRRGVWSMGRSTFHAVGRSLQLGARHADARTRGFDGDPWLHGVLGSFRRGHRRLWATLVRRSGAERDRARPCSKPSSLVSCQPLHKAAVVDLFRLSTAALRDPAHRRTRRERCDRRPGRAGDARPARHPPRDGRRRPGGTARSRRAAPGIRAVDGGGTVPITGVWLIMPRTNNIGTTYLHAQLLAETRKRPVGDAS